MRRAAAMQSQLLTLPWPEALLQQFDTRSLSFLILEKSTCRVRRSLEAGVRWAAAMQSELLTLPWPEALLQWGACADEADGSGKPVWRGLRVRMGIAWGGATYRKPLNTGERVGPIVSSKGGLCACSAGCLMCGAGREKPGCRQMGATPLGLAACACPAACRRANGLRLSI